MFLCTRDLLRPNVGGFLLLFSGRNIFQPASEFWQKFQHFLRNLNLFPSVPPSTDEHELRSQRISTRWFIFLLIILMTILLLYTSLVTRTKTIYAKEPSLTQYEQLYSTYSQTLTCACTQISITYDKFLHVNYTIHQVCSSQFMDDIWIRNLTSPIEARHENDFRIIGPFSFQALRSFCKLTNITISGSLTEFYSRQYVGASVIPLHLFESETKSLIDQFRLSMINSFSLSLSMIQNTNQANALLSALETNYRLKVAGNGNILIIIDAQEYNLCKCSCKSTCIYPSVIHHHTDPTSVFDIPDFYTGCFVIEALLQSTLRCFYDQQCINSIHVYLSNTPLLDIIPLNSSLPSNYSKDSTIQELVDNLMIEQWNASAIYKKYYNECRPTQCTYTVQRRNDIIYIVTTLFGIIGGLTTVLRLILPRLVNAVRKKREHPRPATSKRKLKKFRHYSV
jgi:hypothetical protein